MKNRMHYDQRYETLLYVHRLGSYSAAGEMLGLTPSAVAQQIHAIEEELNTKLFVRKSNRLIPTKTCDLIADSVSQIQTLIQRLDGRLSFPERYEKHITVGITPSVESGALARVLTQKTEDNATVTVKILPADTLCELLGTGALDVAVSDGDFPKNELNSILLDTDRLVIAVPPDSVYAENGYVTLTQLQKEHLILRLPESGTRRLFEANLVKAGKSISDFTVMMEAENVDTIIKLVSAGYGVSVLSEMACKADRDAGRIATVRLLDMEMSRSIHILYRPDRHYDGVLKKIQDYYNKYTT